jgi:hypothetical protein
VLGWIKKQTDKMIAVVHGRSMGFFIAFFITGTLFAIFGKLTMTYVYFMGTLGGLVLGHSIKDDVMAVTTGVPPLTGPEGVDKG